ncbi:MAG TPA: VOC family protein [Gemmatimonadales bacterium]|nr:VOC family protein [Gemmatimonadales bacterium]
MRLDGIHHISCITGDAVGNLDFYTRVLGLRLVAKTVNQDDPTVYHLFYADYDGSAGAELTFFEIKGARPGRAGAGMVHRIAFRVASEAAFEFWSERLADAGRPSACTDGELHFTDPEGLALSLVPDRSGDAPLRPRHPEIPAEVELLGFDHVVAYGDRFEGTQRVLEEVMGAAQIADGAWELRGDSRRGTIRFDAAPTWRSLQGGGTVHHVAWATEPAEHDAWLERLRAHEVASTEVIDRHYFRSIYFREPSGVLYELATKGPGFTVDDPLEQLGSRLILPPMFEPDRAAITARLTPLPDVARR